MPDVVRTPVPSGFRFEQAAELALTGTKLGSSLDPVERPLAKDFTE